MSARRSAALVPVVLAALALSATPARADDAPPPAEPRLPGLRARVIAALPFGAGQFQHGDLGLAIFFAAGEAILGGLSIATAGLVDNLAATDVSHRPVDLTVLNDKLRTATMVNRLAFAGWASLTVAGVIEAQVSLTPRRAPVTAAVAPLPGGGWVGIGARF